MIFQDYGGATTYSADYIELLASRLDPCVKLYFYPYKNATAPRAALDRFIDLGLPVTVIRTPDLYQSTLTKYKVNYLMNDGPKHPQPILSHLFAMQIAATVFGALRWAITVCRHSGPIPDISAQKRHTLRRVPFFLLTAAPPDGAAPKCSCAAFQRSSSRQQIRSSA